MLNLILQFAVVKVMFMFINSFLLYLEIYFDWNSDGHTEHVGIVERVENGTVYTGEGNASNTCAQRHYVVGSSDIYGYGIPVY